MAPDFPKPAAPTGSGIGTMWYINNIPWGIGRHHTKRETRAISFIMRKMTFFQRNLNVDQRQRVGLTIIR